MKFDEKIRYISGKAIYQMGWGGKTQLLDDIKNTLPRDLSLREENRTCFNGLYRVNSKGKFNVPHGKYANPKICDEETLRADSAVLQRVEILCGDFEQTGKYAGNNVLYYFDPPYRPLTETSAFYLARNCMIKRLTSISHTLG